MSGYLTVRETAEVLNMHFMSVYKLVQTGQLPALKIGSRWKIDPEQLADWIARRHGARRSWLLVGSAARQGELTAALGAGHELRVTRFDELAAALREAPDVVLIDASDDPDAALAALSLCREQSAVFTVLLVTEPDSRLVSAAVDQGLVTLMSSAASPEVVAQIEGIVARS